MKWLFIVFGCLLLGLAIFDVATDKITDFFDSLLESHPVLDRLFSVLFCLLWIIGVGFIVLAIVLSICGVI